MNLNSNVIRIALEGGTRFIQHAAPNIAAKAWVTKPLTKKQIAKISADYGKRFGKKTATTAERFSLFAEDKMGTWAVRAKPITIKNPVTGDKTYYYKGKPNFAQRTAMNATWNMLYPSTNSSAFASGFVRGTIRTSSNALVGYASDVLLGVPGYISKTPQYSAFIRSGASAYKEARASTITVNRFSAIAKAYRRASDEAMSSSRVFNELLGQGIGREKAISRYKKLGNYEKAGYITGRLGTSGTIYYGLTDRETRQKRVNKLKKTFRTDAQKEIYRTVSGKNRRAASSGHGRTYVDPYVRNGHPVKGYWRSY